jgi:hypothetical protein
MIKEDDKKRKFEEGIKDQRIDLKRVLVSSRLDTT